MTQEAVTFQKINQFQMSQLQRCQISLSAKLIVTEKVFHKCHLPHPSRAPAPKNSWRKVRFKQVQFHPPKCHQQSMTLKTRRFNWKKSKQPKTAMTMSVSTLGCLERRRRAVDLQVSSLSRLMPTPALPPLPTTHTVLLLRVSTVRSLFACTG